MSEEAASLIRIWSSTGLLIALLAACDQMQTPVSKCPLEIRGAAYQPAPEQTLMDAIADENTSPYTLGVGSIQFGGEEPFLVARIDSVAVECVAVPPAVLDVAVTYDIAVTATIDAEIKDLEGFSSRMNGLLGGINANLVFEAVSANGVVLRSELGEYEFRKSTLRGASSVRITGLGYDEASRIEMVRAGWRYK